MGASGNAGMNFILSIKKEFPDIYIYGMDLSHNFYDNNYCYKNVLLPKLDNNDKVEFLNKFCKTNDIQFVHAQPDPEVKFLLENKEFLDFKVWDNDYLEYLSFEDKLKCQRVWSKKLGLKFRCHSMSECMEDSALFKEILRTNDKVWVRAMKGAGSKGALPVKTLEHAIFWADYWEKNRNVPKTDFMVSEYLPGREFAVQTLWKEGELISSQARERVEYFFGSIMPSGQSSTPSVARTVHDRKVYDTAYLAIKAIAPRPHGIYCVDLKENSDLNIVPLEVNYGRFFTTSNFFSEIGVNGPAQLLNIVFSNPVHKTVESIREEFYWTRGLDRQPYLAKKCADGSLIRVV